MPIARLAFSKIGALIWMLVVDLGISVRRRHGGTAPAHGLTEAAQHAVDIKHNP